MKQIWPLAVAPLKDELLSSFLVRNAYQHGMPPYSFCSLHFGGQTSIWDRDIDRSASTSLLQAVAVLTGITVARANEMTLAPYEQITSAAYGKVGAVRGIAPWINALGIYHRTRIRPGLQFCPDCIDGSPVYLKAWRISFVTVCEVHLRDLEDRCPVCSVPVIPSRAYGAPVKCHSCSYSLGALGEVNSSGALFEARLKLQQILLNAIEGKPVTLCGATVEGSDLLCGLHIALSVMRKRFHRRRKDLGLDQLGVDKLELLAVEERAKVVAFLYKLLEDWPGTFLEFCQRARIPRDAFFVYPNLPAWLRDSAATLPQKKPRIRSANRPSKISLKSRLASLQRQKPSGWRTERAKLLIEAARK